jgi:hypothetical protein
MRAAAATVRRQEQGDAGSQSTSAIQMRYRGARRRRWPVKDHLRERCSDAALAHLLRAAGQDDAMAIACGLPPIAPRLPVDSFHRRRDPWSRVRQQRRPVPSRR